MLYASTWTIGPTKVLTRSELRAVLADLERRGVRSPNARLNQVIVRLACCCGLRVSEIANLRMADVRLEGARPQILVHKEHARGHRVRVAPLWWNTGTLDALAKWVAARAAAGAACDVLVAASRQAAGAEQSLSRHTLRKRFRTTCTLLGQERLQQLTVHHSRHTFVSLALAAGRSLAAVRDAAGHTNISTTSCYLHVLVDEDGGPSSLL